MHEHHDEDLILDLLGDPDVADAQVATRLEGCEQCLADLAEQRTVAGLLTDLEPVSMTGTERAQLRSAVLAAVAPAKVIPLVPKRAWDWTRLGTVAAALVGVVAVAGLFSMIGGDAEQTETLSDQVAAAEAADSGLGDEALELAPQMDDGDGAAEEQAESDFAGASIAAPSDFVTDLGPIDRPGFEAELERIRSRVHGMTESSGVLQRSADTLELSCTGELSEPGAVRAIVTAMVDGLDVEVYLDGDGGAVGYASMDCSTYDLP